MQLKCVILRATAMASLMLAASTPVRADDWKECSKTIPDKAACSRLISSGTLKGHDLAEVYGSRAMTREFERDFDGAIADYDQAIKAEPKDAFLYYSRGEARRNKGDLSGAIADYEQGFAVDPKLALPFAVSLANDANDRGDYATILRLFRPLADQGNAGGQTHLGRMYEEGYGVPQDYNEAVKLYRLAADQGYAEAQFHLGFMHFSGRGVPQNNTEALRLFRLAADQGDPQGQRALGLIYFNGLAGEAQSYTEAVKWYTLAAEQGDSLAQSELGILLANGQGVPQDYVRAHMWFNLSAAKGEQKAVQDRDRIAKLMTSAQIAEAQKLAREWKPGIFLPKDLTCFDHLWARRNVPNC